MVVGDRVVVREAWPPGHIRTPAYIRGHAGTIVAVLGRYPNPEELAFGRSGHPALLLLRVRFRQIETWPDYAGSPDDTIDVEIYEHWLHSCVADGERRATA